ncbi:hypothetical protein B5X24_HaOG212764 [Helicoverpa armigera]|uniref:Uncharacterized protein n=1 Tax=Helicoverpa armigera TaxID=29058 RepID=A0A2W1BCQ6_HELAM|nr:hypothetical protein B5X24_HaOG212764 [Helicoverpa armigera]
MLFKTSRHFRRGRLRENHKSSEIGVGTPTPRERLNGVKTDSTRSIKKRSCDDRRLGGWCEYIAGRPLAGRSSDVQRTTGDFPRDRARRRVVVRGERRAGAEPPANRTRPRAAAPPRPWRPFIKNDVHPTY